MRVEGPQKRRGAATGDERAQEKMLLWAQRRKRCQVENLSCKNRQKYAEFEELLKTRDYKGGIQFAVDMGKRRRNAYSTFF